MIPARQGTGQITIQGPQIDSDGNDVAGRLPGREGSGHYTGWALRKAGYAEGELLWTTADLPVTGNEARAREELRPRPL